MSAEAASEKWPSSCLWFLFRYVKQCRHHTRKILLRLMALFVLCCLHLFFGLFGPFQVQPQEEKFPHFIVNAGQSMMVGLFPMTIPHNSKDLTAEPSFI